MIKSCKQCSSQFEITNQDLGFYDKISPIFAGKKFPVPPPQLCPDCRQQRRLAMRNERTLYHRKSDLTGKQIIAMFAPSSPYKVYDQDEWWSDQWDANEYGREFDFNKTFSEQFKALQLAVPHVSLNNVNVENGYYTNFALNQKNSYLVFGGSNNEDCIYGKFIPGCKDCVDNYSVYYSELCYEGVSCERCYNCKFLINSRNCSDCIMIENCQSCQNCIGCFGLQAKQYYVFNQFIGKEKYEEIIKDYQALTTAKIIFLRNKLNEIKSKLPHVSTNIFASEDCTGDNIYNSKNCHYAFNINGCEDCKYIFFSPKSSNTYDSTFNAPDGVRFCYNVCSSVGVESGITTFYLWYGSNILYSTASHYCDNILGCVGLKHKKYCILNKQYSKEAYEKLVPKIVAHMVKTGEWGEYFNYDLSLFGYNETVAQEYYPLTKDQALQLGANWQQEDQKEQYQGAAFKPPENINEVNESICNQILTCEATGKNYKIIPQELKFYKKMGLPIPNLSPDQRHLKRLALHNPLKLWTRNCAKCGQAIQTSFNPKRPEIVYCQNCYLKEVY